MTYVFAGGRVRNYADDGKTSEGELKTGEVVYREPLTHAAENIGITTMHATGEEIEQEETVLTGSRPRAGGGAERTEISYSLFLRFLCYLV